MTSSELEEMLERMYNPILFKDRIDGGKKLARELKKLDLENPVVLAIPSGGVPVGIEVSKFLDCPFDLIIVRKIKIPWNPEAGFGSVASDGVPFFNPDFLGRPFLSEEQINKLVKETHKEVEHREKEFLAGRKRVDVEGKTVILIDDGLASGYTMLAAIKSIKKKKPDQVIIAAPTASGGAIELLEKEADKVVTLYKHPRHLPFAVASSYKEWHDLTDEEVKRYLQSARK